MDHYNDLLHLSAKKYPQRYQLGLLFDSLDERQAPAFEAFCINTLLDNGYTKTPRGQYDIEHVEDNQLFNKRRGLFEENIIALDVLNSELFNGNNY